MEIGLILFLMAVQFVSLSILWVQAKEEHKNTQDRLYQAELLANQLDSTIERLTKSVDNAENLMLSLSKREEALKTQEHLLQMREGGWRGV